MQVNPYFLNQYLALKKRELEPVGDTFTSIFPAHLGLHPTNSVSPVFSFIR